jgi:hypothetical protein
MGQRLPQQVFIGEGMPQALLEFFEAGAHLPESARKVRMGHAERMFAPREFNRTKRRMACAPPDDLTL